MVREDYVSVETAKLLKEKGFDEQCHIHYKENGNYEVYTESPVYNSTVRDNEYCMPTQPKVLKWLREVHQIYISIECCYDKSVYYTFDIFRVKDNKYEFIGCSGPDEDTDDWSVDYTYEKAEKRAIDYCLTHLL